MSDLQRDFIESLDVGERDLYAEMVMRSLRGNWSNPKPRANILETIADVGGLLVYDDETLAGTVKSYKEKRGWDGRHFRTYYGEVNVSDFDETTVRELSSHIPDDLTWDDYRINKEFNN